MAVAKKSDGDLEDILQLKLKEHQRLLRENEELWQKHKKEADFHRQRVEYITQVLTGIPSQPKDGRENLTDQEKFGKPWYWRKTIKEFLDNGTLFGEFRNGDVIEKRQVPEVMLKDKETKAKITYAVSMALSELCKDGTLMY